MIDDDTATVGITEHAQSALGDVVFVELPANGSTCTEGEAIATIESVKAASDVYAPIAGEVIAVNTDIEETPEQVNEDPEGAAWFFKLRIQQPVDTSLWMDRDAYLTFAGE